MTEWHSGSDAGIFIKRFLALEANSGVSLHALTENLGIPERNLIRRKAASRLAPDEWERLLHLSSLLEKAVELFEGRSA